MLCAFPMLLAGAVLTVEAEAPPSRWSLGPDGALTWTADSDPRLPHRDHIEMSGRSVSLILRYAVEADGRLALDRHMVWPMLRTIPNDTHASLSSDFGDEASIAVSVNGVPAGPERLARARLDGLVTLITCVDDALELTHTILPSTREPAAIELVGIRNVSTAATEVSVAPLDLRREASGVHGDYIMEATCAGIDPTLLEPGAILETAIVFSGRLAGDPPQALDLGFEEQARRDFVRGLWGRLRLETPDPTLNATFGFAKVRAAESIFATRGGLMHGPGGGAYYAAIWANDQAEYANPFFPFLGDPGGDESALNSFRHFAGFMDDEYRPIPSSIIAEGVDIWNGAGDRGDAAMVTYGAARFALAKGDRAIAEELWPLIEWCLEYCRRKLNDHGVVSSDCDELEFRFPAGDANLNTSCLTYGGLRAAASLGRALGHDGAAEAYDAWADVLRTNIEGFFGARVEGFDTYRYYEGNDVLRAWICVPLTMGILERTSGTLDALFSPRLWTPDGLATQAGEETFWDRATLYGLRGAFAAGATGRALPYLSAYSRRRLLGDHVPYPVEAWPEGNQRHLSAESALYCRVFTEGLFGVEPTGLRGFRCLPRLPEAWDQMALRDIQAFGTSFDLVVERTGSDVWLMVVAGGRETSRHKVAGEPVEVRLPN